MRGRPRVKTMVGCRERGRCNVNNNDDADDDDNNDEVASTISSFSYRRLSPRISNDKFSSSSKWEFHTGDAIFLTSMKLATLS